MQNLIEIRSATSTSFKNGFTMPPDCRKYNERDGLENERSIGNLAPEFTPAHSVHFEEVIAPEIFRPVQYLGSKLRVVEAITTLAAEVTPKGARIADLFTGSTVVSQAFANRGFATTAVDTQAYSVTFAQSLLGIDRKFGERFNSKHLLNIATSLRQKMPPAWLLLEAREDASLARGDAKSLRSLYRSLPLAWRSGTRVADPALPLTSFYSGTYFGVRQALELDAIQAAIALQLGGASNRWQRATATTALMHAASVAVHSAGKHFAQPLKARDENIEFLDRRLLTDRLIDVPSAFAHACNSINDMLKNYGLHHRATKAEAERYVNQKQPQHDLYYLDPPYTAQQYSRFYHILETIATGVLPNLPFGEAMTSGIYSTNRYKSAFSSKKKAPEALAHILRKAAQKHITVLVSYSISAAGSDGNARMIRFDELLSECCKVFGTTHVEFTELAHRYRQFNSGSNANQNRNDTEVLVLCRPA